MGLLDLFSGVGGVLLGGAILYGTFMWLMQYVARRGYETARRAINADALRQKGPHR